MLRKVVLGIAMLMTVVGAVCLYTGYCTAWPLMIWGAIVTITILFERWRYRQSKKVLSDQWEETGEQFIDPESGQLMQVLYHPGSGERRYIPIDDIR